LFTHMHACTHACTHTNLSIIVIFLYHFAIFVIVNKNISYWKSLNIGFQKFFTQILLTFRKTASENYLFSSHSVLRILSEFFSIAFSYVTSLKIVANKIWCILWESDSEMLLRCGQCQWWSIQFSLESKSLF